MDLLNAPIKRHRVTEWIKKKDLSLCCLQETHFKPKDIHRLKVKGWKNILHVNNREKKAGVTVLISDKITVKKKRNNKRQRRTLHMRKGSVQRGDITIKNIYAHNTGTPKYVKQVLTKLKGFLANGFQPWASLLWIQCDQRN